MGAVVDTGPTDVFSNRSLHVGGGTARVAIDTYDQAFFPTRGFRVDATHFEAVRVTDRNGLGFPPYSRSELRLGAAWQPTRFAYLVELDGGTSFKGKVPLADAFSLGGPRRLAGFARDQMLGGEYFFGRVETQYRLNFASPLYGLTLIGGLAAEAGKMNKLITESSLSGWQRSFSAYIAASTFLGPVYIGVADSKNGKGRFYLSIGTP
jgi:NTE family protein